MTDPHQTDPKSSDTASTQAPGEPSIIAPGFNPEKNKELAKEIDSILRGIPLIGPYIVIVKLKWGWTGIVLLVVGFMIATIMVFTGLFPASAVSDKYKAGGTQVLPPEVKEYELKAQHDVQWDAAIKNAKTRIWASGVALSKLNPQLVTERVKEGVSVQLVYVDPCGETIKARMADENNPDAVGNIKGILNKFDTFTRGFSETQTDLLKVKLSNAYPTMVVMIIDSDLYAYFCPYGAVCSNSPVLVFKDYYDKKPKNASAKFFEDHVLAVSNKIKAISNYTDPCASATPNGGQ